MVKLIIIRGPSGSGKSTIARHLGGIPKENWFEADMYFDRNGHYAFDASRIGHAHQWCQENIANVLASGNDAIVSNTFSALKELEFYLSLPAEILVIRTPPPWDVRILKERNVHVVPTNVIERQIARYVALPQEIEWNILEIFDGQKI